MIVQKLISDGPNDLVAFRAPGERRLRLREDQGESDSEERQTGMLTSETDARSWLGHDFPFLDVGRSNAPLSATDDESNVNYRTQ